MRQMSLMKSDRPVLRLLIVQISGPSPVTSFSVIYLTLTVLELHGDALK